jgi:hypothetical protein
MTVPQIDPWPPAPGPSDPGEVFDAKAFDFTQAMEPRRQQMNEVAGFVDTRAQDSVDAAAAAAQSKQDADSAARAAEGAARVYDNAVDGLAGTVDGEYFTVPSASGSGYLDLYKNNNESAELVRTSASEGVVVAAELARDEAEAARNAAQSAANFLGSWASQSGAASVPATVLHDGQYWQLLVSLADISTSEPSASNSDWDNIGNTLSRAPAMLDGLRRSVEAASGGRMTVFYTASGQPSYFVRQGKFLCEDIAPGGELGTGVHEAFVFDGVEDAEIWVGAYQGVVINGEAVSQPGLAPGASINYDQARSACQAAGAGFDLMSVWDWAAISLWCMANGFQPRGNTNHGRHHDNRWETGTRQDNGVPGDSAGVGNTLTGSGPAQWRHDQTMAGIADMVGNVWEWLTGMKMVDARVLLSPDNAIPSEAGYSDTLFDLPSNRTWSTVDNTGASDALKRAMIVPKGIDDPIGYLYTTLTGERLPFRGGNRNGGAGAGLGALYLIYGRTGANSNVGFRPRFRNP